MKEIIWDREKALLPASQRQASLALYEKRLTLYNQYEDVCKGIDADIESEMAYAIKQRRVLLDIAKAQRKLEQSDPCYLILAAKAQRIRQSTDLRPTKRHCIIAGVQHIDSAPIDTNQVRSEIKEILLSKADFFDKIIHTDESSLQVSLFDRPVSDDSNNSVLDSAIKSVV